MLKIKDSYSVKKEITQEITEAYAKLSGDLNPVHLDDAYATEMGFKHNIAHGMLIGAYISAAIGIEFPGKGTIYLEQDLKFVKPIYIGEVIEIKVTVGEIINEKKGIYRLETVAYNEVGELAVDGYAVVKYIGSST